MSITKEAAREAVKRVALEQALTQQRVCATCGGRGEIGGHVGQTAETFDYVTEPCPECTTPQPSADAVREGLTDEDVAVLRRLKAALPTVGLNGWMTGVRVLTKLESLLGRGGK